MAKPRNYIFHNFTEAKNIQGLVIERYHYKNIMKCFLCDAYICKKKYTVFINTKMVNILT